MTETEENPYFWDDLELYCKARIAKVCEEGRKSGPEAASKKLVCAQRDIYALMSGNRLILEMEALTW